MRISWPVLILLVTLAAAPLALVFLRESAAANACRDAGGSYDYSTLACDPTAVHPRVPFAERHGSLILGSAMSVVGLIIWGVSHRRRSSQPR